MGALADQVAEHTIALMTPGPAACRRFSAAQQKKEFIRRPTRDLTRATVGCVGLGGVGRRLARLLRPFQTRILAVDMFPIDKPDAVESLWPLDRLDELLGLADFVVLSVPLNPTTCGMIDAATMRKMKQGAVLVNVARGPLVVEGDLVAALANGYLAGAVMDVTPQEPLPDSSRLWDLPQVIITPHVGGQAAWRNDKITDLFCRNLLRWKEGRPLINFLADKRLGFPIRGGGYPLWEEVEGRGMKDEG